MHAKGIRSLFLYNLIFTRSPITSWIATGNTLCGGKHINYSKQNLDTVEMKISKTYRHSFLKSGSRMMCTTIHVKALNCFQLIAGIYPYSILLYHPVDDVAEICLIIIRPWSPLCVLHFVWTMRLVSTYEENNYWVVNVVFIVVDVSYVAAETDRCWSFHFHVESIARSPA